MWPKKLGALERTQTRHNSADDPVMNRPGPLDCVGTAILSILEAVWVREIGPRTLHNQLPVVGGRLCIRRQLHRCAARENEAYNERRQTHCVPSKTNWQASP